MKDYNKQITYASLNSFVQYANDKGYEVDCIEGVLNDTYVIYNLDKELSIKGVKARDFIVLYPKFLNAWSNTFHILMTNDESKVEEFLVEEEV
tara:strand:- start:2631 stop:2909 length:279 start_codon:yes stop_codon:yes gene_type:complete